MSDQSPTPASSAETDRSSSFQFPFPRSVRVLMAVILYVFSIGPMFWYWYEAENMGGNPLVRVVYAPLRLLCAIPPFNEWLNNYINWWIA